MSEPIRTEDGKIRFELSIPADAYVNALNSAYRRLASRYQIPGFRKGKAPARASKPPTARMYSGIMKSMPLFSMLIPKHSRKTTLSPSFSPKSSSSLLPSRMALYLPQNS